ncbi:MAG: contact-dependent growth inhibition system immunity protein [Paracoccaceae bacterium]
MDVGAYQYLRQLFGAYFHEDWADEFGTTENVVAAFMRKEPAEVVAGARRNLSMFIETGYTDQEIDKLLQELGCYYYCDPNHSTYFRWLQGVLEIMSTQLE